MAAYQASTSPGTANSQAIISAGRPHGPGVHIMNSGKATMRARVPALPAHCTSIRRAPAAARASTATEISTSRTSTAQATTAGTLPSISSEMHHRAQQDPVGRRVEHLAELADLAERRAM